MKTVFNTAALLLALKMAFCAVPACAAPPDDRLAFREAMAVHAKRQWQQSYAAFVLLADGGDARAARIAAQMHRWGPRLYGMRFAATPAQLARWQQASAGRA